MKYFSIKENHLFSKVYKKGKKAVARHIVVYVLKDYKASTLEAANPMKQKINRIGITVSKRAKTAIERNRCRRIIREAYRLCNREYVLKKGFLIVMVARDSAVGAKSTDIKNDLIKLFSELNLLT